MGKTTLIKSLVKHYTRHNLTAVKGPVTVVSGKLRRLQFVECGPELANMARHYRALVWSPLTAQRRQVDAAKFADLVLLLVDGNFGFEMETFEFLNVLQVHGFPKVMGVLTHLDEFTDAKKLRTVKKTLKVLGVQLVRDCLYTLTRWLCSNASGQRYITERSCSISVAWRAGTHIVPPRCSSDCPLLRRYTDAITSATSTTWRASFQSQR